MSVVKQNSIYSERTKSKRGSQTLEGFRYKFLEGTLTVKDILDAEPKLTRAQAEKQLKLLRSMRPKKTDFIGKREYSPHERERNPATKGRGAVENPIAQITKAYIRHYSDNGQTKAYVEWIDDKGKTGRTEGTPGNASHIEALLSRARREGITVEKETWNGTQKQNATAADFRQHQKIRLEQLAQMFQGEASGEKRRVLESEYTPNKKYRLGHLKLLKVKSGGKIIPIVVDGDEKGIEAYLAADLRNNLLIVGKDAVMENIRLPRKGDLRYLGELVQIDYVTAKKHIGGGKLIHFYHKLGEVTGEHPNLFVDDEGCLIIQGGGYDVWDVGIVN